MMSALAFGYGVGMATPDATLNDMRVAVDTYRTTSTHRTFAPPSGPYHAWAGGGPTAMYPYRPMPAAYGYAPQAPAPTARLPESRELARLRAGAANGAHSCKLHNPTQSLPPHYASTDDGAFQDNLDELDPAGQEALSRLQLPDFNVPITRRALKYVRFLTRSHRGRDLFESWLKRSGRYTEMIQQTLREWHLPEDLIWVAMIESGFDPKIKSPAGAMGLWQFMQATGKVYGLNVNRFVDERKNPIQATQAAAHHLRDLHQRFGAWDLAFAAYNMGYEQLLDRIDRYGTTDFNELSRQRALPSETAAYVPKIVAAALVANNLERYGFDEVKVYRPVHISEMAVPGGTPVKVIARAAGISTSSLRKLNPHLRTKHVPPGGDYNVMVPPVSLSRARAALPAMMDTRTGLNDAHILEPEDLFGLSGNKKKQLKHNSWTEDENLLRHLPKPKRRSLRNVLTGKKQAERPDDGMGAVAEEFAPRRGNRDIVMYRVGPGDTLIGLAKQFAVDIDDLARDNGLDPDDKLREGALLKLMVKPKVLHSWKQKAGRLEKAVGKKKSSKGKG